MQNLLLDDYNVSGNDLDTFKEAAVYIDSHTFLENINLSDLHVCYCGASANDKYILFHCSNARVAQNSNFISYNYLKSKLDVSKREDNIKEAFSEIYKNERVLFYTENTKTENTLSEIRVIDRIFLMSDTFKKTYSARQKNVGGSLLTERTFDKALSLQKSFEKERLHECYILYRGENKVYKAFAVFSKHYRRLPLGCISNLIECRRGSVRYWNINHKQSEVYFELSGTDAYKKYIPGFVITASDTGFSEGKISLVWRRINAKDFDEYFIQKEVSFADYKEDNKTVTEHFNDIIKRLLCEQDNFYMKIMHLSKLACRDIHDENDEFYKRSQCFTNMESKSLTEREKLEKLISEDSLFGKWNRAVNELLGKHRAIIFRSKIINYCGNDYMECLYFDDRKKWSDYAKQQHKKLLEKIIA